MYTHATLSRWGKKTCSAELPFPFCPNTVGCTDSDLALKGLRALPFSLSRTEQKDLCSWIWVWVRGSVCVYTGGLVVNTTWLDH